MVVVDYGMQDKHGDDTENFVLSIMSTANRLIRHPSIGLVMSVVVSKVRKLEEKKAA